MGRGEPGLRPVFQMQMAELLVSHGASLSARTSMDEMPIGKFRRTTPALIDFFDEWRING